MKFDSLRYGQMIYIWTGFYVYVSSKDAKSCTNISFYEF